MSGYGPRVNGNVARRLGLGRRRVGRPVERLHLDAGFEQPPVGMRPCPDPTSHPSRLARRNAAAGRSASEHSAGPFDRVERDPLPGVDVRPDRLLRRGEVAGVERVDDRAVLARQVLAALGRPPRITCIIRFTDSSR